ncbi:PAS-domain containing protein [Sulfitobacter sp. LCG007]
MTLTGGTRDLPADVQIHRQEKIIRALIRRADRQNDIGTSAFRAFQSAIALQERVDAQTRDLKRAETELESVRYERERTRRSLVDALSSMADGFALFLDGQLHVTNDFFLSLLPDTSSLIAPGLGIEGFFDLISSSTEFVSSDRNLSDVAAALVQPRSSIAVVIGFRRDRWYNLNAQQTSDDNVLVLLTDITELVRRNRFEKETLIDFQKDYLKAVFQNMSSGVCTVAATGQVLMFNLKFQDLLGLGRNELTAGVHVDELFRSLMSRELIRADDIRVLLDWRDALGNREFVQHLVRRRDGQVINIHAYRLPDGGYVIELKDVTLEVRNTETLEERVRERTAELTKANDRLRSEYGEKARVEEQLRLAKERLEAAMSSKTRFLAAASHDLLQPINAAQLMISTLKEATRDTEFQQLVERLDGSFTSAEQLLRSLLDISRLESASPDDVSLGAVGLHAILAGIYSDQVLNAAQRQISLDFVPCSATVLSDPIYLLRSIQNLVVNAIQYTRPGGRVLVGCRRHGRTVELQVWDTGIGIPRREQKRVFEEFARAEGTALATGMGLGLSVVERACRLLGHKLSLRSKPGVGSVFSITMEVVDGPVKPEEPTSFLPESETRALDQIVLVIENDEDVLFATTQWLERAGAGVLPARCISEAVAFVNDMGMPPDIILADYQLDDGETGIDAITRIRDMADSDVPAIVITANRSESIRQVGTLKGVSFMTKPAKLSRLRRLIDWKTSDTYKGRK